jgi:hypothetical protein
MGTGDQDPAPGAVFRAPRSGAGTSRASSPDPRTSGPACSVSWDPAACHGVLKVGHNSQSAARRAPMAARLFRARPAPSLSLLVVAHACQITLITIRPLTFPSLF